MNPIAQIFATITLAAWLLPSINGAAINNLDSSCVCTLEFEPICGSDGATYFNNCLFNCATENDPKLQFYHDGACEEEESDIASEKLEGCKCSREYLPICATDDQTYDNECQLNCQRKQTPELGIQFQGQCEKAEQSEMSSNHEDDCICTRIFDPVCGSDRKTYSNVCHFTCQQNKYNNLKIVHRGECKAVETKSECICTREYNPVCGSNGKTYSNECELNCEHRIDETLQLESKGPCELAVLY